MYVISVRSFFNALTICLWQPKKCVGAERAIFLLILDCQAATLPLKQLKLVRLRNKLAVEKKTKDKSNEKLAVNIDLNFITGFGESSLLCLQYEFEGTIPRATLPVWWIFRS